MKKKTVGIILIVIAALNMVAWIPDISNGKSKGALYYIFIIIMLLIGIILVNKSSKTTNVN